MDMNFLSRAFGEAKQGISLPYFTPLSESVTANVNVPPKKIYPSASLTPLIRSISLEARSKLQRFDFYPNWLCLPSEITLHETEVDGMISHLKNLLAEMLPTDDSDKQLRIYGLAPIISNNALTYLMILKGDFRMADEYLTESNRLIDICHNACEIISNEYMRGMFYIAKGLKLLHESHTRTLGEFSYQKFLMSAVEEFKNLPVKGQVAVAASRHFFLRMVNQKDRLKFPSIGDLAIMDPNFFEWRFYQYLSSRDARRLKEGIDSTPSDLEIKSIQDANRLAPHNPLSILYTCLFMAEYIRKNPLIEGDRSWVLNSGDWQFTSETSVVEFIKESCKNVLKAHPNSVKVALLIAEIMEKALPFIYRDAVFARECILQAYKCGGKTSSHCNLQLMLTGLKTTDFTPKLCEPLLKMACQLDSRNLDSLLYLILVYMSEPKAYCQKIRMLFATKMSSHDLPASFAKILLFLKGCFHMAVGETDNAILTWVAIYDLCEQVDFSMLRAYSFVFRVFKWPTAMLNLPFIISETNCFLDNISKTPTPQVVYGGLSIQALLVALMRDQYAALNSDEFYKRYTINKKRAEHIPLHHLLPSTLLADISDEGLGMDDEIKDASTEEIEKDSNRHNESTSSLSDIQDDDDSKAK